MSLYFDHDSRSKIEVKPRGVMMGKGLWDTSVPSLPFSLSAQAGEEVGKWGESYLLCTTQPAEAEDEIFHLSQKLDKKPRKKSSVYFSQELIFLVRENVTLFFPLFLGLAVSVSKFLSLP